MPAQRIKAGLRCILDLRAAWRVAAWTCIAVIAFLSLVPTEAVVRTGYGSPLEHPVAYAGTTFATAMAHGAPGRVAAGLLVYAGLLEGLQHFSPGRSPGVVDYLFSAVGILLGTGASLLMRRWLLTANAPTGPPSPTTGS